MKRVLAAIRTWCVGHKKLTVTLLGAVVAMVPDDVLDADKKKWMVEMFMVYVVGQGAADFGKERAKVESAAGTKVVTYRAAVTAGPSDPSSR